jgi:hypothetical protein
MGATPVLRLALAILTCALAAGAASATAGTAGSTAPAVAAGQVAGSVETKMVINRFAAVGTRIVGYGTATSTLRDANGVTTSVARKTYRLTLRNQRNASAQAEVPCHILFLQLDELDLTLLGLRVYLRAATEGQPIELKIQARKSGGILGKLFCDLAGGGTLNTGAKAVIAANQLNARVKNSTVLQARATLYAPGSGMNSLNPQANCPVLHLILGPLHLDLLGLIVDLNKIALDIEAIPGTLIGNIFCSLVPAPPAIRAG